MVTTGQSSSNGISNFIPENVIDSKKLETEKLFEKILKENNKGNSKN